MTHPTFFTNCNDNFNFRFQENDGTVQLNSNTQIVKPLDHNVPEHIKSAKFEIIPINSVDLNNYEHNQFCINEILLKIEEISDPKKSTHQNIHSGQMETQVFTKVRCSDAYRSDIFIVSIISKTSVIYTNLLF